MKDKDQKIRYTNPELALLKSLFADDVEKLYIIRKVLFQFELTDDERKKLDTFMNEEVYALVVKTFLPYLDPEAPLFQMSHLNLALGADIKQLSPDGALPYIRAKKLEIDYVDQQLKALRGGKAKKIDLADLSDLSGADKDPEQAYVNVIAWNWILSFIDSNIQQLKFLAGFKHETVEQTLTRLRQDSAK